MKVSAQTTELDWQRPQILKPFHIEDNDIKYVSINLNKEFKGPRFFKLPNKIPGGKNF